jgi:ribonuclease D
MLTCRSEIETHLHSMTDYTYVDKPDTITGDLQSHRLLGVDTEFMREKTYFAQLCLLQLATRDRVYCVDPLTDNDMQDFWREVCSGTWVVHSARQDIEVIFQTAHRMPAALFDTQIAASLLGLQPQMGYASLVEELFSVEIPKSHTRADWTRRPLPAAVLSYAVEDVEYLLPAYDILAERLDKAGRLAWAEQDSTLLLDESLYATDDVQAVDRLKGARNLRGRRRSVAADLAVWREAEALRRNRPRQWILRDRVLLEIASDLPDSIQALRRVADLPAKLVHRVGEELLEIVARSGSDNDYQPPSAPDDVQKRALKSMQSVVSDCAQDLGISAEVVASRKELSAIIISGRKDSRVFQGWRRELVGEQLLKML